MTKARDIASASIVPTAVSVTELGFLDGVTSAIQTQLDAKAVPANVINNTFVDAKGDLISATANDTPARLGVGANNTVLMADSTASTGLKYAMPASLATNARTASYTLVAADAGTRVTMNSASATTATINTGLFAANDVVEITNIGAGVLTITAGTATVSTAGVLTLAQNASGSLYFTSTGVSIWQGSAASGAAKSYALLATVSLSSTITTISGLSGYDDFLVVVPRAELLSGADALRWRLNGSTSAIYNQFGSSLLGGLTYATNNSGGTANVNASFFSCGTANSTTGSYVVGTLSISGANSSGIKICRGVSGNVDGGGTGSVNLSWQGFFNSTSVISSISILTLSSTFNAGSMQVYGAV